MFALVSKKYPGLGESRLVHEAVRRVINAMVEDVMAETRRRLADAKPQSVADIRALGRPVVAFSERMAETDRTVKKFLYGRMYEHWHLNRSHSKARRVVMDLFGLLFAEPNCLPPPWRERAEAAERSARARIVADYIAGMTDRYALDEHRRLFDLYN
jgi:dGTPase